MTLPGNEHLAGCNPIHFGSHTDGYSFTGSFAGLEEGTTKFGPAPVYRFEGGRILWAYHAGLKRAWREADPQPGQTVQITRSENPVPFGDEGKAAYDYEVVVERTEPEPASSDTSAQNFGETAEEVFGF